MKVIEIEGEKARRWIEEWLGAGHFVSEAVLSSASFDHGQFRTCISNEAAAKPLPDFEAGWVASRKRKEVESWLAEVLDEIMPHGAKCLIVEDDLSNPTDPGLLTDGIPTAFINERVLAWSDLAPGSAIDAIGKVMVGSGYPRNAFVSGLSGSDLGVDHGQQVPENFPNRVAESLYAVIVSIFDDESYLVWTP